MDDSLDKYRSFKELQESETEGVDYSIVVRTRKDCRIAVVAPHGGGIEPRTAEFAQAIAGSEFNLYCFEGIKDDDNSDLHITSHNFDEPQCLSFLNDQDVVLTLHGCDKQGERVLLGGRDKKLIGEIAEALKSVGISAETTGHEYTGNNSQNICNLGATKAGAQIEMSMAFRKGPNAGKFIEAIRVILKRR